VLPSTHRWQFCFSEPQSPKATKTQDVVACFVEVGTGAMAIVTPGAILAQKGHTMAEVPRHDEPMDGGRALMRSIWSRGVGDITPEGMDILLDSALTEGPLRDKHGQHLLYAGGELSRLAKARSVP
jgi:hypothetical protein